MFLAGDAAHVNNPLGGLGLNFGIHDAIELAGLLGRVLAGAADALLAAGALRVAVDRIAEELEPAALAA